MPIATTKLRELLNAFRVGSIDQLFELLAELHGIASLRGKSGLLRLPVFRSVRRLRLCFAPQIWRKSACFRSRISTKLRAEARVIRANFVSDG